MRNGGDKNGTILEHYGDVLFKLSDITKAIEYWNKAKTAVMHPICSIKKLPKKIILNKVCVSYFNEAIT